MCLATNRARGTVKSNRKASSPGVPPLLVTSKICRSTSSEPAPLPVKTSIRSMCGVSIGRNPKLGENLAESRRAFARGGSSPRESGLASRWPLWGRSWSSIRSRGGAACRLPGREAYWPPLAAAIRLRWSPAKPPARSTQWIGIFRVLSLATSLDRALRKLAVGEQKHGVGPERNGLLHGGPRFGSAVGLDQPQPREQLVLGLEVGRPGPGPARHRDRFVVVEDHLELLRLLKRKDAAPELDRGAGRADRRRACCRSSPRRRRRTGLAHGCRKRLSSARLEDRTSRTLRRIGHRSSCPAAAGTRCDGFFISSWVRTRISVSRFDFEVFEDVVAAFSWTWRVFCRLIATSYRSSRQRVWREPLIVTSSFPGWLASSLASSSCRCFLWSDLLLRRIGAVPLSQP